MSRFQLPHSIRLSEKPRSQSVTSVVPFSQFVLKVHSRCDLACDHCYVYRHADQSWKSQPVVIADETVCRVAERIAEHVIDHQLSQVSIILHGGEPLLAGPVRLERVAGILRKTLQDLCHVDLRVHTNGILLNEVFCEIFSRHRVTVGVSLDGDRQANDLHRRYANGRSSYDRALKAIQLLTSPKYRHLYGGLLCTIDLRNDPIKVYDALLDLKPPRIDFLLPHATWETPPPRSDPNAPEYADWLLAIYDRWKKEKNTVRIRTFDSILTTSRGGESLTEALGTGQTDLVVIETDGTYQQVDSLKTAYAGAPTTGYSIHRDSLDIVANHPGIVARQRGLADLCDTCRKCPVVQSCGGGLYAHRYNSENKFDNPSVYCPDLKKLIIHISRSAVQASRNMTNNSKTCTSHHGIWVENFDELATGYGNATSIGQLIDAQRSIQRSLLAILYNTVQADVKTRKLATDLNTAWDLLIEIDDQAPSAMEAILEHPYFRAAAVHYLRGFQDAARAGRSGAGLATEAVGHISSIAITAALHAGLNRRLEVPVRRGMVSLPSLGRFAVGHGHTLRKAVIEGAGSGNFSVRVGAEQWAIDLNSGSSQTRRWQPARTIGASDIEVVLDDTDPYRNCHEWPAAPRLKNDELVRWQRTFNDAWDLIKQDYSLYASGLAVGLRSVTPLSQPARHRAISATARQAFGAVGAALPDDAASLALLILHEFQHAKLGAILDMYDLYVQTDKRLFHAPWRADLRPFEGLFQGTYAHVLVTDFWRIRANVDKGETRKAAARHFLYWYPRTAAAIDTLMESGSLTELGERFLIGMRSSIVSWRTDFH